MTACPPGFHARLRTPASRAPVFEVGGCVTPYDLQTLVGNVESFPRRSRLEVLVHPDAGTGAVLACREHLAPLVARGILVAVRRGHPVAHRRMPASARERERRLAMPIIQLPEAAEPAAIRRSVLVAEDDPDMRRMVATLLRMAGHHVIEAADGADLLARLDPGGDGASPEPVDVIVSDIDMPQLSGLDLLAALRCSRWNTPVVLVTAYGDQETRAEARELGASAFLDKPLDPEALRRAVATAAAVRGLVGG